MGPASPILESLLCALADHKQRADTNRSDHDDSDDRGSGSAQVSQDLPAILDAIALENPSAANWRTSIADLLALGGLDNGEAVRHRLALELSYSNDDAVNTRVRDRRLLQHVLEIIHDRLGGQGDARPDYLTDDGGALAM